MRSSEESNGTIEMRSSAQSTGTQCDTGPINHQLTNTFICVEGFHVLERDEPMVEELYQSLVQP